MASIAVIFTVEKEEGFRDSLNSIFEQIEQNFHVYMILSPLITLRDEDIPQDFQSRFTIIDNQNSLIVEKNDLLSKIKEKYICYLRSGDIWLNNHIALVNGFMSFDIDMVCFNRLKIKKSKAKMVHNDIYESGICHTNRHRPMWTTVARNDRMMWTNYATKLSKVCSEYTFLCNQ